MTQTNKTAKAKTETNVFPMFDMPKFDMPKFDTDAMEVPAAVREFADKALTQTKTAYDNYKVAAEDATEVLEDTFAASSKHATDLHKSVLANAKANINASFDFADRLFGVKTVAEVLEVQTAFARQQFDMLTEQTKDMQAKTQKAAEACTKPAKAHVTKTVEQIKSVA